MASALTLRPFAPGDLAALAPAAAEAEQAALLDGICAEGSGHHVFLVLRDASSPEGDWAPASAGERQ